MSISNLRVFFCLWQCYRKHLRNAWNNAYPFKFGFPPWKTSQPRKAWNYNKSVYLCVYYTKSVYKEPKQKVSANSIVRAHRSKEIVLWEESSRVQLCKERNCWHSIEILTKSMNSDRKIMQLTRITSRLPSRIRKWNQLSQHSLTSVKVIPI